jgi:hypothetical protein
MEMLAESNQEIDYSQLDLDASWRLLAPIVDDSLQTRARIQEDPALLKDPWALARFHFILCFDTELAAVQTVFHSIESGAKLTQEEIDIATSSSNTLLKTIHRAREITT